MRLPADAPPSAWATPQLVAWVANAPAELQRAAINAMANASRAAEGDCVYATFAEGCVVGLQTAAGDEEAFVPAVEGGHLLWMVGEIFDWPAFPDVTAANCRRRAARERLLGALLQHGPEALADVDGEYLVAHWDGQSRTLNVITDRFGSVPAFYGRSGDGTALATSARAVAVAPGISPDPDDTAIRQAVTFGGFRLGARTLLRSVSLQTPGTVVTATESSATTRRYWCWPADVDPRRSDVHEAAGELHRIWQRAIDRRLVGAERPGLHLSGGLDSRAILAALVERQQRPQTITFGTPHSEEVRCAAAVAKAARVPWHLVTVYGERDDWLSRREEWIYHTDGLIDLADLRHVESLDRQADTMDVHLSGYFGDLLLGERYNSLATMDEAMFALPYYGGALGWDVDRAREEIAEAARSMQGAPARFMIYEHKYPQSLNRWTVAWRPWVGVRKPFTSYALFDFAQSLPAPTLVAGHLRERWLKSRYPVLFSLPDSRTAAPVMAPAFQRQFARARRYAMRRVRNALSWSGVPPVEREATPDIKAWRRPDVRARIEERISSQNTLVARVFDLDTLRAAVRAYFEHGTTATQVIGALFAYETFHRELPARLVLARQRSANIREVHAGLLR